MTTLTGLTAGHAVTVLAATETTVPASGALRLSWLLLAFPLFGATVLLVGGRRTDRWGHLLGVAMPVAAFVYGVIAFFTLLGDTNRSQDVHLYSWIPVAGFQVNMNLLIDQLSICFVLLITGVGSLIIIYSVGYMAHDPERRRFFGYMNLFLAAMLLLVLGDNYLVLYAGWEGVGLASYLLIGFWQYKNSAAVAAKKAFIANRVGDAGLSIAIMLMFAEFGTVSFTGVFGSVNSRRQRRGHGARAAAAARRVRQVGAGAAAVLAARRDGGPDPGVGADPRGHHGHRRGVPAGAVQPDPRAHARRAAGGGPGGHGHAAVRRHHRLRQGRHQEVAGRVHHEPDRLHVRSGPASGPSGYVFAIALLLAHGFYKAGLFLGAGSVMHGMDDEEDMRRYGGLARYLPVTYVTFGLAYLAIIGIPPFSGFFAKDPIIDADFSEHGTTGVILGICALIGAGITAFYMTRMMFMTWYGKPRWEPEDASARVASGDDRADDRARDRLGRRRRVPHHQRPAAGLPRPGRRGTADFAWLFHRPRGAGIGAGPGRRGPRVDDLRTGPGARGQRRAGAFPSSPRRKDLYGDAFNESVLMRPGQWLTRLSVYFDNRGVDGLVNSLAALVGGTSGRWRRIQTGFVRSYALSMFFGAAVLVALLLAVRL